MSIWSLERECERENLSNRKVDNITHLRMADFWRNSYGNFFISGDEGGYCHKLRRELLMNAIKNAAAFSNGFLVILHNDAELEAEMIQNVESMSRDLIITSNECRNYQPFFGMDVEKILTSFDEVGRFCGYHNMPAVDTYARAFMEVVKRRYPISLQSMLALSRKSPVEIEHIAEASGIDPDSLTMHTLRNAADGKDTFCQILNRIRSALLGITHDRCETGYNMITAARGEKPRVIMINVQTSATAIFNIYLKQELEEIRGRKVSVIFDDISIKDPELLSTIRSLAINPNNSIGLCAGDIFNMVNADDLRGYNTQCILRHADLRSLGELLKTYGQYRYVYVEESEVIPDGHFWRMMPQKSYRKAFEVRDRVRLDDMKLAVLKGNNAERITITDDLR